MIQDKIRWNFILCTHKKWILQHQTLIQRRKILYTSLDANNSSLKSSHKNINTHLEVETSLIVHPVEWKCSNIKFKLWIEWDSRKKKCY